MRTFDQKNQQRNSFISFLENWGLEYQRQLNENSENLFSKEGGAGMNDCCVCITEDIDLSEILDEFGRNNLTFKKVIKDSGYNTGSFAVTVVSFI